MSGVTSDPDHFYHSSLITTTHNVSWTIHNLSDLAKYNAWTAYYCSLEVPFSTHRISNWSLSLYENSDVVYIRPKLLSPQNETLTYQLSVRVAGEIIAFGVGETTNKEKNQPKFNIGSVQSILEKSSGDDTLQLGLHITVFHQDHWETKND